jgi:hypothetical protein
METQKPRRQTNRQIHLIHVLRHKLKRRYVVDNLRREIDITPFTSFDEIPVPDRYYVRQLAKTGFSIQLTLFNQKQIINSEDIEWEQ